MPLAYGLIEPAELHLPHLPPRLDGLRIVHMTDLHVRRRVPAAIERLGNQLTKMRLDIAIFTGDYMEHPGHESAAFNALQLLLDKLRCRYGVFGVFGNHDTAEFRKQCQSLPVHWLSHRSEMIEEAGIEVMGLDMLDVENPDSVALALNRAPQHEQAELRFMLAHAPSCLTTAADFRTDVMFSGHTHGGQCRLPNGRVLMNASDLPLHLTAGLMRHRDTLAAISRGIGFTGFVPRTFCRPQVPVYTLRKRSMPGQFTNGIEIIQPW